jgi:hypothetical protein
LPKEIIPEETKDSPKKVIEKSKQSRSKSREVISKT